MNEPSYPLSGSRFRRFLEHAGHRPPRVAVILGSGLGDLADRVYCLEELSFADIPSLQQPTVPGHQGRLLLGTWAGQTVLLFCGRLHYYEGLSWPKVVQPVRIAIDLGAQTLLLTNAAGGIRDDLVPGSLLSMNAHLPWPSPGLRRPFDSKLIAQLKDSARALGITLPIGTYAQVSGPCYETPAEIRALKLLGVDAVGMSTAHEADTAFELGLPCAALSCITNRAAGLGPGRIHHDEVLSLTSQAQERIGGLIENFLRFQGLGQGAPGPGDPSLPLPEGL